MRGETECIGSQFLIECGERTEEQASEVRVSVRVARGPRSQTLPLTPPVPTTQSTSVGTGDPVTYTPSRYRLPLTDTRKTQQRRSWIRVMYYSAHCPDQWESFFSPSVIPGRPSGGDPGSECSAQTRGRVTSFLHPCRSVRDTQDDPRQVSDPVISSPTPFP